MIDTLLIFFDTESTGLSCYDEQIVELAAIAIQLKDLAQHKQIRPEQQFCQRVRAARPIHRRATQCHGIRDRDLSACETFDQVYRKWSAWLLAQRTEASKPVCLIGHNAVRFDIPLLWREMLRCKLDVHTEFQTRLGITQVLDSLPWAKSYFGAMANPPESMKLTALYEYLFRTPLQQAHSALADTLALVRIMAQHCKDIHPFTTPVSTVWTTFQSRTTARPLNNMMIVSTPLINNNAEQQQCIDDHHETNDIVNIDITVQDQTTVVRSIYNNHMKSTYRDCKLCSVIYSCFFEHHCVNKITIVPVSPLAQFACHV